MEKQKFLSRVTRNLATEATMLFGLNGILRVETDLDGDDCLIRLHAKDVFITWHIMRSGTILYCYGGKDIPRIEYTEYYAYDENDDHEEVISRYIKDFMMLAMSHACLARIGDMKFEITAYTDNYELFMALMQLKAAGDIIEALERGYDRISELEANILS